MNLNRPVTRCEMGIYKLKKKTACKQKSRTKWLHWESYHTHKEEFTAILLKLLQKTEGEETLPKSFYEAKRHPDTNQAKTLQKKKKKEERNLQAKCLNNMNLQKLLHKIFIT